MLTGQVLSSVHSWPQVGGEGCSHQLRIGWAGFLKTNQDPLAKKGNFCWVDKNTEAQRS